LFLLPPGTPTAAPSVPSPPPAAPARVLAPGRAPRGWCCCQPRPCPEEWSVSPVEMACPARAAGQGWLLALGVPGVRLVQGCVAPSPCSWLPARRAGRGRRAVC